jgi:hypothetical protein
MRIKLKVITSPGAPPVEVTTNLLCIAEWEKTEGRKVSDGRGIGVMDMVVWAHFMMKLKGEKIEPTAKQWLQANPDMEIESVDITDANPTDAALTAAN